MSNPFVAEIRIFAGSFAPKGWALCAGQLMSISQNTALFSLLGTFYGGDGKSNFALPNLQDNVPIGQGQSSASGTQYFVGEQSGTPYVTLINTEMPVHTHNAGGAFQQADLTVGNPNAVYTRSEPGNAYMTNSTQNLTTMYPLMVGISGGSQPHNNMMPFMTLTYIIALQGVFPARG